jgi:hypothetical protein
VTLLPEPPDDNTVTQFPSLVWASQRPLWRVHRASMASIHFARGPRGRFNPPSSVAEYGTWYLSSHPRGALIEVFGRFGVVARSQIETRVLARVQLPSDAYLADLTHPTMVGRYSLTNELSLGGVEVYDIAHRWSAAFWSAGFAGICYPARHDPTLQVRNIAIFGSTEDMTAPEAAVVRLPLTQLADEMADFYSLTIVSD